MTQLRNRRILFLVLEPYLLPHFRCTPLTMSVLSSTSHLLGSLFHVKDQIIGVHNPDVRTNTKKVVIILALGLGNLLIYTDILDVMVLNPIRRKLHRLLPFLPRRLVQVAWTSNIPSSPYAMDALSTMISGPFPSLVDHNACMPGLELPCILKGRPPKGATYWR